MDKVIIPNARRYRTSNHARAAHVAFCNAQQKSQEPAPIGPNPIVLYWPGNPAQIGEYMESVSSNYPGYFAQDTSDDSRQATLISHVGASVERNQDAQFASLSRQHLNRDVLVVGKDAQLESLRSRYELATQIKDFEIRNLERHSDVKAELAALRTEQISAKVESLRAESQDGKFAALLKAVEKLATK